MNSSFSTQIPNLQIAWDSTSLSALKECPRKYYYSIVLGYQPKMRSFHLTFGILYHEALEAYDHARARGSDHNYATSAAVLRALQNSWDSTIGRPWSSPDPNKNRLTLIRTIVWYLDQFVDDAISTVILANGAPAVELSFRYPFQHEFTATSECTTLCGHLDRVGDIGGQLWIIDRKTTKQAIDDRYFAQYSPDNQMSAYSFAGRVVYGQPVLGVIVDAAQVGVTFSRFRRGFAHRTETQLEEWARDTALYLSMAEHYAISSYWPMNDKSCYNYGGCPFRKVCSRSPEVREEYLETTYTKCIWDPLQIRGDI